MDDEQAFREARDGRLIRRAALELVGVGRAGRRALLGALLMLLILLAIAPHPAPAALVSGKENGNLSITMDDAYLIAGRRVRHQGRIAADHAA